jgi:hypothetical protein
MKVAVDFSITNARDGKLSDAERRAALARAQEVLDAGGSNDEAEYQACAAAFSQWLGWPESAVLEVEVKA